MDSAELDLERVRADHVFFSADPAKGESPIRSLTLQRGSWEAGGRPTRISVRIDALPDKD